MEEIIFTRQELYDLVWSEPLSRLAKKYNLSDNGIRKRCKKMNIPLPTVGYWSKIKFGYKVAKIKLPQKYEGEEQTIFCYRDKDGNYIETATTVSPFKQKKEEFLNSSKLTFEIPEVVHRYNSFVAQARDSLKKEKPDSFRYIGMVNTHAGEINIMVSKPNINRAIKFLDALIKLLESRGHEISNKNNSVVLNVNEIEIGFQLKEKTKIIKVPGIFGGYDNEYHPNDIFVFRITEGYWHHREWKDGKQKIEEKLLDILIYIELLAEQIKEQKIKDEIERNKRIEEEQKRQVLQKRKDKEFAKFKELYNQAINWKQAQVIREYLEALSNYEGLEESRKDWLDWAKHKIEWYDPLTQKSDKFLDNSDRLRLTRELNEMHKQISNYSQYW